MVKPGQRPPPPPPHAKQQGQEHEDDAEVARATANAPPAPMLAPPPLPIAQAFPARRETGPMGDRARQEDICAVCYQGEFADYNQILYCDGCNLGLHQHCANIPEVPEGEDPYWCPYCVVANAFPSPAEEPPPVCRLCGGRGGGLIRAIVGEDGTTEEGEPSPPRPPQPPQFVHKTCALAGMGRSQGPVRFLAGSNGGVALLSSTALRAATSVKTEEEEGGDRPQRCRHCGAGDGLLLPCRGAGGEGGCPLAAHASCAFEAAAAALLVDAPLPQPPKTTTPPVHIWCSLEHAPPPEQANPGADAVAACLGLLPPVGSQPALPPSAAPAGEGKVVQAPQHFRGAAALFGGYLDDKAKLLLLAREQGKLGRDGASRVVLVGRQQQQQAGAGGSGGGVQVVYALRDAGSLLPPPETPRAGTAQEQAEMEVDTSE